LAYLECRLQKGTTLRRIELKILTARMLLGWLP